MQSLAKINTSLENLVDEATVNVINNLKTFLGTKIDIDDDMSNYFNEFQVTARKEMKTVVKDSFCKNVVKRTREPSSYNMYISKKMAQFKEAGHTGNLMKMAIDEWNKEKSQYNADSQSN